MALTFASPMKKGEAVNQPDGWERPKDL